MRVKRGLVLLTLLVSLASTGWCSYAAITVGDATSSEAPERGSQNGVPDPGASLSDPEARTGVRAQDAGGSPVDLLFLAGAAASGIVLLASLVIFRVEVRREKDIDRMREDRSEYRRDMRRYNRQMRGPPRDNT